MELNQYKYAFVILCFAVTLELSALFDYTVGKLDSIIYKKKEVK